MKISKQRLHQIIKEETEQAIGKYGTKTGRALNEEVDAGQPPELLKALLQAMMSQYGMELAMAKGTLIQHLKNPARDRLSGQMEEGFMDRMKSRASGVSAKSKGYAGFDYAVKARKIAAKRIQKVAAELANDIKKMGNKMDASDAKEVQLIIKELEGVIAKLSAGSMKSQQPQDTDDF